MTRGQDSGSEVKIVKEGEYDYVQHMEVVSEANTVVPDSDTRSLQTWVGKSKKLMKHCEPNAPFRSRILLSR